MLGTVDSLATVHYVDVNNANPATPYTNWSHAATSIQDAVDAAVAGDLILVTNGVYKTGGRQTPGHNLTNRVLVANAITVLSVNGPEATIIQGYQMPLTTNGVAAVRCVYLTNGATLSGFTLSNGATLGNGLFYGFFPQDDAGGGVFCAQSNGIVVSNCVLAANSAVWGGAAYQGTFINCGLTGNSVLYESGAYSFGGGAYGSILTNCTLSANYAVTEGGGAAFSTLYNCTLNGNSSYQGGGAIQCSMIGCILVSNSASVNGGGAMDSTLSNCLLTANSAVSSGGGGFDCTLNNCTLSGNSAQFGGGATLGLLTMNNCTLANNSAQYGGGVVAGNLNNCLLTGNTAQYGGGVYNGTANNCTIIGNSATNTGGGAYRESVVNTIIYFNSSPTGVNFDSSSVLNYCCTIPLPTGGTGNITNPPLFIAGNYQLQSNSPCLNAGNNASVTNATDLGGNPRIAGGIVDIGAYEFQSPEAPVSPLIQIGNLDLGAGTNQFGFTISWAGHNAVVVEACTNLASPDWIPVSTNSLTGGSAYFNDPQWTNYADRFYRVRTP